MGSTPTATILWLVFFYAKCGCDVLILDDLEEELNDCEPVFAEDDDIGRFNYESIKKFLCYGKMHSQKERLHT